MSGFAGSPVIRPHILLDRKGILRRDARDAAVPCMHPEEPT